eukprot:scaffold4052_cov213-Amphora_coffeaeformis.AAC.8
MAVIGTGCGGRSQPRGHGQGCDHGRPDGGGHQGRAVRQFTDPQGGQTRNTTSRLIGTIILPPFASFDGLWHFAGPGQGRSIGQYHQIAGDPTDITGFDQFHHFVATQDRQGPGHASGWNFGGTTVLVFLSDGRCLEAALLTFERADAQFGPHFGRARDGTLREGDQLSHGVHA